MIPFSPPPIDEEIIAEISDTIRSGWWTTGPKTKLFEKQITAYIGCDTTLCLNSATAGMELVLRWFGVKKGDEVILPAYTYSATANVVMHCGAIPVMVDVGDDFNISLKAIKKAITPKTKVIIAVDIAGYPCDYNEIVALIESEKSRFVPDNEVQKKLGRILFLSDAAHAFGAKYGNKMVGTTADFNVFSFHAVKNLPTAEGGAVCINLSKVFDVNEIYKSLNRASLHGQSKDALEKSKGVSWRYDILEPGYKCNMTDIHSSIGIVLLKKYDQFLAERKSIFDEYLCAFKNEKWAILPPVKDDLKETSYHIFMLRIAGISENQRDQIIDYIFSNGVSVNVHFQPLPLLSAYKNEGYLISDYPNAYKNYACEITLPVFVGLTKEQMIKVIDVVKKSVAHILSA
jgi:dTDP-4-amino-4,6-dideoxygalactose transaminase